MHTLVPLELLALFGTVLLAGVSMLLNPPPRRSQATVRNRAAQDRRAAR